jgi:hypothetical protein
MSNFEIEKCLKISLSSVLISCLLSAILFYFPKNFYGINKFNFHYIYILTLFVVIVAIFRNYLFQSLSTDPILWILYFLIWENGIRLYLCLYWIILIILTIYISTFYCIQSWRTTIRRKIFHFLAVLMFLPPLRFRNLDGFMTLAFSIAFSLLLLIEVVRLKMKDTIISRTISCYYSTFLNKK